MTEARIEAESGEDADGQRLLGEFVAEMRERWSGPAETPTSPARVTPPGAGS